MVFWPFSSSYVGSGLHCCGIYLLLPGMWTSKLVWGPFFVSSSLILKWLGWWTRLTCMTLPRYSARYLNIKKRHISRSPFTCCPFSTISTGVFIPLPMVYTLKMQYIQEWLWPSLLNLRYRYGTYDAITIRSRQWNDCIYNDSVNWGRRLVSLESWTDTTWHPLMLSEQHTLERWRVSTWERSISEMLSGLNSPLSKCH